MAKVSGNDLVAKALADEGVDTVFYLTGGPMVDVASRCIERFRVGRCAPRTGRGHGGACL